MITSNPLWCELLKLYVCGPLKYNLLYLALQAFQTYDVDRNETITKGEFRRVLETFCFPMTTDQFCTIANKVAELVVYVCVCVFASMYIDEGMCIL